MAERDDVNRPWGRGRGGGWLGEKLGKLLFWCQANDPLWGGRGSRSRRCRSQWCPALNGRCTETTRELYRNTETQDSKGLQGNPGILDIWYRVIGRVGLSHLIENSYKENLKSLLLFINNKLCCLFLMFLQNTLAVQELSFPIVSSVKSPVTVFGRKWKKEVRKKKASEQPRWMAAALSHHWSPPVSQPCRAVVESEAAGIPRAGLNPALQGSTEGRLQEGNREPDEPCSH